MELENLYSDLEGQLEIEQKAREKSEGSERKLNAELMESHLRIETLEKSNKEMEANVKADQIEIRRLKDKVEELTHLADKRQRQNEEFMVIC